MFRYMIENSTTAEMQKWFKDFFVYIKSICDEYRINPSPEIQKKVQDMSLFATKYDFDAGEESQRSIATVESIDFVKNVEKDAPVVALTTLATVIDYVLNLFQFIISIVKILLALEQKVAVIVILLVVLFILVMSSMHNYYVLNDLNSTVQQLLMHQKLLEKQIEQIRNIKHDSNNG